MLIKYLLTILLLCIIAKLFSLWRKHAKFARVVNCFPGPPTVPIFGNSLELWVAFSDTANTLFSLLKRYCHEPIIRLWIGWHPVFIIQQGIAAEILLQSPDYVDKADEYKYSYYWIGQGLLSSPREKWEKLRKLHNLGFHTKILEDFIPLFNEHTDVLLTRLSTLAGKGPIEVTKYMSHLTLDIICETSMGVKMRIQEDCNSEFLHCMNGMVTIFTLRVTQPWMTNQFLFNLTKHHKDEIAYVSRSKEFTRKVIMQRRHLRNKIKNEEQMNSNDSTTVYGQKPRLATLDLLFEAEIDGKPLTDDEILGEVILLIIAGHDTAACSMSFTLCLLGWAPEIQKRVQEEIDDVLGELDRPVTNDDLCKFRYLEAVIKESLRLYPTIPIMGRKLREDVVINDLTVPAGTTIVIPPYAVHRDPNVFPDPEKFDPERFLNSHVYSQYEYIPFSAGPRNCIGHRFAMIEQKVVLSRLLKAFTVVSHTDREKIKLAIGPVLHSHEGIYISLEKRK